MVSRVYNVNNLLLDRENSARGRAIRLQGERLGSTGSRSEIPTEFNRTQVSALQVSWLPII